MSIRRRYTMLRVPRHALAAALIAFALVGCRDAAAPNDAARSPSAGPRTTHATEATLVRHIVPPKETDPEITLGLSDHYVWLDPTARGNPKLLLFMPGTNNVPASWQLLGQEAARLGYHVIGLMYQNDVEVVGKCGGSADANDNRDPDCSGNMRLEIIDGIDHSSNVTVTSANSIDNRLAKLLAYLDHNFADEGWSRFLEQDGTPKWSQIAVSGQSQGAGQAALIGTIRQVDRVVMFSGPPDMYSKPVDGHAPLIDSWISIGKTPAAKYFALFHDRDHLAVGIRVNLRALDMERFGAPVKAEASAPPYGGVHILFTDLRPTQSKVWDYLAVVPGYDRPNPHQSTARDNNTPLGSDGAPLLRDAWRYLLGEPPRGGP